MDDEDLALALRLQAEFNAQEKKEMAKKQKELRMSEKPPSLGDTVWELIDPNPDIHALFLQFNDQFFWGQLNGVEVKWSPQMTLCAGLCVYERRAGYCSVRLSLPLLKLRPRVDLIQTLLHEMIHAYLFVTQNIRDHDSHGPNFHEHMYRINKETSLNITVYHTFHDEVNYYRQHWWKCDGPCQKRPPYFGIVRRAMNRTPGPNDLWWAEHQRTCGGKFIKIQEPDRSQSKAKKRKTNPLEGSKDSRGKEGNIIPFLHPNESHHPRNQAGFTGKIHKAVGGGTAVQGGRTQASVLVGNDNKCPKKPQAEVNHPAGKVFVPFSGTGHVLGGGSGEEKKMKQLNLDGMLSSPRNQQSSSAANRDEATSSTSKTVQCPVCSEVVPSSMDINQHLDDCLDKHEAGENGKKEGEENSEILILEYRHPCPVCMVVFSNSEMSAHISVCLNKKVLPAILNDFDS